MRRKAVTSIVTAIVFLGILGVFVGYIASLGLRVSPPAKRTNLSLEVADVSNVVVDSNVLLRGVPVGKITSVDTSPETATIHLYVGGQYEVPVDSDVRVENLSALGESYIELEPRSSGGPKYRDGQRIVRDSVKQPPSISELGASVVHVLNQLDPQQLSRVVREADEGLPDPGAVLPNLARTSMLVRNMTLDFKGKGSELLDNFQVLLRNAGFVGPALAGATTPLRDLGPVERPVWNDIWRGALLFPTTNVLGGFSALIQRLQALLDDRGADLKVLGEATSANVKLIGNALKNFDSSRILENLLATVPEDGAIDLHVQAPSG